MGFFKNIFKRKKRGTLVGNIIRGAANKATGGILGNGAGLAKWEAEQTQNEVAKLKAELAAQKQANALGSSLGAPYASKVNTALYNSPQAKELQNNSAKEYLKRNWWMIALPVTLILGLTIALVRKK